MKAVAGSAACALLVSCAGPPPLLLQEQRRHPLSGPQDLYKAAYQACLGPEHALSDRVAAARHLTAEMAGLGPAFPGEPLIEPLPVQGAPEAIARVNLRPLRDRGLPLQPLLEAVFAARPEGSAGRACLTQTWRHLVQALGPPAAALDATLRVRGYPAVHHTPAYQAAYAPAYRVAPITALRKFGIAAQATR